MSGSFVQHQENNTKEYSPQCDVCLYRGLDLIPQDIGTGEYAPPSMEGVRLLWVCDHVMFAEKTDPKIVRLKLSNPHCPLQPISDFHSHLLKVLNPR